METAEDMVELIPVETAVEMWVVAPVVKAEAMLVAGIELQDEVVGFLVEAVNLAEANLVAAAVVVALRHADHLVADHPQEVLRAVVKDNLAMAVEELAKEDNPQDSLIRR